jgi:hypothetical protein
MACAAAFRFPSKEQFMHPLSNSCTFLLAAVLAVPAGALADAAVPCNRAMTDRPMLPAPLPRAPVASGASADALGVVTADAALDKARGGSDRTTIETKLSGSVSNNSATNVTTGSNIIQGGSFAGMSGIPIVVQNSGANVLIQNATVINLQLK